MAEFLLGAQVMASAVIGMFFLRFWRRTRDPLFVCFAFAFWALGTNWLSLALVDRNEPQTGLYSVRLIAFGLIIVGIWFKNRKWVTRHVASDDGRA